MSINSRSQVFEFLKEEIVGPKTAEKVLDIKTGVVVFESREASIGPWKCSDTDQEILPIQPRDRYGAAILEPVKTKDDSSHEESSAVTSEESIQNPEVQVGETEALVDTKPATDSDAQDKLDLEVKSNRAWNNPRSVGASFYINLKNNGLLRIILKGGTYRPITAIIPDLKNRNQNAEDEGPSEEHDESHNNGRDYIWYVREAFEREYLVHSEEFKEISERKTLTLSSVTQIGRDLDIDVTLLIRKHSLGAYLCTASFVNRSERKRDENNLYQTSVEFISEKGAEFIPYPESERDFEMDVDDESALLLYRNYPTFAIGHNMGVEWSREASQTIYKLTLTAMPTYEAPSITPTITYKDGTEIQIDMRTLADINRKSETISLLEDLCREYFEWIQAREKETTSDLNILNRFSNSAQNNISECLAALNRMRNGIDLLKQNENVYEAFCLANLVMLRQQYHSRLPERVVKFDGRVSVPDEYPSQEIPNRDGMWRPFQIAFFLSVIESIANPNSVDRDLVDLIFFPTGGGKTEAYLGVSAFTILLRRIENPHDAGTVVLMRYTLRLLTTQQFIRAAAMICALEEIRQSDVDKFGESEFSIGAWLGGAVTPNSHQKAIEALPDLRKRGNRASNPFLLLRCPWCGATLGPIKNHASSEDDFHTAGYKVLTTSPREFRFFCPDARCLFAKKLPLTVIDEEIYKNPPTLVIGTVDKFAQMAWQEGARSIFGIDNSGNQIATPPQLIIQDEFHLISGPLGSMVGLYESIIEELCSSVSSEVKVRPKIISSTATIRRFKAQAEAIYGRNRVALFPPPGLDASDSFFAVWARKDGKLVQGRLYVGINAPGLGSVQSAQVRVGAALAQAPMAFGSDEDRDPWWTNLWFFNSIRELSNTVSLFQSDIPNYLLDMKRRYGIETRHLNTINELTSRRQSHELPKILSDLEQSYKGISDPTQKGVWDACLASNIIEVGIDIPRLSLMTVVSQPKSTSQYIQVSGRIGRAWNIRPGMVVTIYTSNRPRDLSHFEHFRPYHERLYAQVEPTSVTPFASPVLVRALRGAVVAFIRMRCVRDSAPKSIDTSLLNEAIEVIKSRANKLSLSIDDKEFLHREFSKIQNEWAVYRGDEWGTQEGSQNGLLIAPTEDKEMSGYRWTIPVSMRSVDASVELEISRKYRNAQLIEEDSQ